MENLGSKSLLISKLRIKDTINKIKNSSPHLQEILRQRSREEMIERRKQVFNKRRFAKLIGSNLSKNDCEENLEMEENLYREQEHWMLADYDRMLQKEIEWIESLVYDDKQKVICPICQVNLMVEIFGTVSCEVCGFRPTNCNNIQMLENSIENSVNNHSQYCTAVPGFSVVEENKNFLLYMTCETCSFLTCVI
ncbi:PREDICTED: RPA-interacting protein-like [Polistes canadensis]|uniref:RPA-interacting protein-like n=1 Tax=Polistes canadensis TaxID=91411 RepID=UPI000718DBD7|nr:PREDICTED: RPA-interacting protein-like [Polistes canadensis]XP_014615942.1 PREDICTED: RPA-interacting protein-like [Polistes canadensis]XP_014615943.1 PREDICTED: RPA-interacting protein-like [Polistes canadensis]